MTKQAEVKKPRKVKTPKDAAWDLLMNGESYARVRRKLGAEAEDAIKEVLDGIGIPDAASATKLKVETLSELARALMPKAKKGDEVAINAVVKIIQVQQQLILAYQASRPAEDSTLETFRKDREKRKKKNSSKIVT